MRTFLLIVAALGLEAVRLSWLARFPAAPDLLLGLAVLLALRRRPAAAAATGFLLGAIRDLVAGDALGVETASFTVAAWGASSLGRTIYRESVITQALMIAAAILVRGWIRYVSQSGEGGGGLVLYLVRVALPSALVTALLVPWAAHRLSGIRFRRGRRRRRRVVSRETTVFE